MFPRIPFLLAIVFTITHIATAGQSWRMVVNHQQHEVRLVKRGDSLTDPNVVIVTDSLYQYNPRKRSFSERSFSPWSEGSVWDGFQLVHVWGSISWMDYSDDDSMAIFGIHNDNPPDGDGYGIINHPWPILDTNAFKFYTNMFASDLDALHFYTQSHLIITAVDGIVATSNADSCKAKKGLDWKTIDGATVIIPYPVPGFLYVAHDSTKTIFTSHAVNSWPPVNSDTTFRTIDTGRTRTIAAFTAFNAIDYDPHTGIYYGSSSRDSSHGLYRSTNDGLTFQKMDTITAYSVGVDSTTGTVYIGGNSAIYASTDSGRTVHLFNNTIPQGIVNTIITNTGGPVLCASSGGVFELLGEEVGVAQSNVPVSAAILNIAPNPVSISATISFSIPNSITTQLRIFDMLGRCVEEPVNGLQIAGEHSVEISMSGLCAGMYVAELVSGGKIALTMMLVKW